MLDSVFSDDRKKSYFNPEGKDKPMRSPVPHSVLVKARDYRRQRMLDSGDQARLRGHPDV